MECLSVRKYSDVGSTAARKQIWSDAFDLFKCGPGFAGECKCAGLKALTSDLISGNDPEMEDFVPEEEGKEEGEELAELLQVMQAQISDVLEILRNIQIDDDNDHDDRNGDA